MCIRFLKSVHFPTFVAKSCTVKVNFYAKPADSVRPTIVCYCSFDSKRISFSTKLSVPARKWNSIKQRAEGIFDTNSRLQEIEEACYCTYNDLSRSGDVDAALYKRCVLDAIFGGKREQFVVPYYEKWATTPKIGKKLSRQATQSCSIFARYAGPSIRFQDVNYKWIEGFLTELQGRGYSLNYIGTQLKNLKAVMNAAYMDGLHDNLDFKKFKKMEEDADSIYLTSEEIGKIENVGGLSAQEEKARDLFLVGYYTAMRFSDYSRLSLDNIEGGIIKFVTQKTGEEVRIPANPKLVAILRQYGGRAPKMDESSLNLLIKSVCRAANIDDFVTKNITKGGEVVSLWRPKYEFVSSHTARRSGATNMYKAGIKTRYIMMITGHKTELSFRRYIRISKLENAESLADNPFFKG